MHTPGALQAFRYIPDDTVNYYAMLWRTTPGAGCSFGAFALSETFKEQGPQDVR